MRFRHTVPKAAKVIKSVRRSLTKLTKHGSKSATVQQPCFSAEPSLEKGKTAVWLPHITPSPELPEFSSFIASESDQEDANIYQEKSSKSVSATGSHVSRVLTSYTSVSDRVVAKSTPPLRDVSNSNPSELRDILSADKSKKESIDVRSGCSHSSLSRETVIVGRLAIGAALTESPLNTSTRVISSATIPTVSATSNPLVKDIDTIGREPASAQGRDRCSSREFITPARQIDQVPHSDAVETSKEAAALTHFAPVSRVGANAPPQATSSTCSSVETFEQTLNAINYDKVCSIALKVRRQGQLLPLTSKITCTAVDQPMSGAYNFLKTIKFSDGVKYLARTPGKGLTMSFLEKMQMDNEYQTMRYIKKKYDAPVPTVYHWTVDETEVGAPFALLEYLPGRTLSNVWDSLSIEMRQKVLTKVVIEMVELAKVPYDMIGTLRFTEKGKFKCIDGTVCELFTTKPFEMKRDLRGPWDSLQAAIYDKMDLHTDEDVWQQCDMRIAHMAVQSIPGFMLPSGVISLGFPDLNTQNILVDEECNITGLVDWSGVTTAPLSTGATVFPIWIMNDWDPLYCEPGKWGGDNACLSYWRKYYRECFAFSANDIKDYDPRMTKYSHILKAIENIHHRRDGRNQLVERLLDHAFDGKRKFTMQQYCNAFLRRRVGPYDDLIIEAFAKMWQSDIDEVNLEDNTEEGQETDADASSVYKGSCVLTQIGKKARRRIRSI